MAKDSPTQHPFTKALWSVTYICEEKKIWKNYVAFLQLQNFPVSNQKQSWPRICVLLAARLPQEDQHAMTGCRLQHWADSKLPHKQNNQSPIWSGERGWEARYSIRDRYDSRSKGHLRYTRSCDTSHSFSKDPTLHHLSMGTQLFTLFCKGRVHSLDA